MTSRDQQYGCCEVKFEDVIRMLLRSRDWCDQLIT